MKPQWGHTGSVSNNSPSDNSDPEFANATQIHPFLSEEVENYGLIEFLESVFKMRASLICLLSQPFGLAGSFGNPGFEGKTNLAFLKETLLPDGSGGGQLTGAPAAGGGVPALLLHGSASPRPHLPLSSRLRGISFKTSGFPGLSSFQPCRSENGGMLLPPPPYLVSWMDRIL